jgi:hypothetical protein
MGVLAHLTFKHLPQPLRSHILSFGSLGQLFKIPPFPPKNRLVRGVGGERREEEKKMAFIVATNVYPSSQGQRTHSARNNFPAT